MIFRNLAASVASAGISLQFSCGLQDTGEQHVGGIVDILTNSLAIDHSTKFQYQGAREAIAVAKTIEIGEQGQDPFLSA